MRPVARNLVIVGIVAIAVVGGFAGGWLSRGSGSSTTGAGPVTLSVIAAGSLAPPRLLPSFVSAFANETPGVSAPLAAQLYEGSTAGAAALAGGGQPYDIFVAADFRVIPQHLEAPASTEATWEVVFASDPLVLAYEPGISALSGINSTNWYTKITAAGVTLGWPNATADPLGVDTLVALELEDTIEGQGGALYDHFFTGGEGEFATPTANTKQVSEDVAATALSTGEVDVFPIYQSYAVADHLAYVALNSSVNLGGTNRSDVAEYGSASTKTGTPGDLKTVVGAPILFALTVPASAPDPTLGVAFAAFLLGNASASVWATDGFSPLVPAFTDQPAHLPAALSGSAPNGTRPLPSYLSALLA